MDLRWSTLFLWLCLFFLPRVELNGTDPVRRHVIAKRDADKAALSGALTDLGSKFEQILGSQDDQSRLLMNKLTQTKTKVDGIQTDRDVTAALSAANGAIAELPKLMSSDPAEVIQGLLNIGSQLASLGGPAGAVIAGVASFVSGLIGMFTGQGKPSMAEILEKMVKDALRDQRHQAMLAKSEGAQTAFIDSKVFLEGFRGHDQTEGDINGLSCHVPIYQQVSFMGELASYIGQRSKGGTLRDGQDTIQLVRLYVGLHSLRGIILKTMYDIYTNSPYTTSTEFGFMNVINERDATAKNVATFLRHPEYEQWAPVVVFEPEGKDQDINKFLDEVGVPKPSAISNNRYRVVAATGGKKWQFYPAAVCSDVYARSDATCFNFWKQSKGFFHIGTSSDRKLWITGSYYGKGVCKSGYQDSNGAPSSEQKSWKLIRFKDGNYWLTSQKSLDRPAGVYKDKIYAWEASEGLRDDFKWKIQRC